MARQITFTIEITDDGMAKLEVPHGKSQQKNATEIADLTKEIAEAIGKIEERHQPVPHHHHHSTDQSNTHQQKQEG